MNSPQEHLRASIGGLCAEFDLAELRAMLFLARRLSYLRQQYGPLGEHEGRKWLGKIREELADALLYLAMQDQQDATAPSHSAETLPREIARVEERLARIEDRLSRICPLST